MKTQKFGQDRINDVRKRLSTLSDEDYDYEIFDFLSDKENLDEKLSVLQLEIMATYILEYEVNNGGFDQFFLNNEDKYIDAAINGLKKIEAVEFTSLAEKAKEIYLSNINQAIIGRNHEFDVLDDSFYDLPSYRTQRIAFTKKHLDEILIDN
ncbi:DMP19 family protein [Chondrinema litorale]|uniref:DMP19 family protein n=1 Tax=Chondrinema litorale TaxID=2994555 RepID=UPI002542D634|nr:DUF4375 domain-containing protein [Chondrinema litorale]UZR95249.1 DUF4375 domain-containing protein [Chondrinema litorale]